MRINAAFGPNAPDISACVYDAGSPVNPEPSPLNPLAVMLPVTCNSLVVDCIEPVFANIPVPDAPDTPVNPAPEPKNDPENFEPDTSPINNIDPLEPLNWEILPESAWIPFHGFADVPSSPWAVSYTHLRAHET